MNIKLLLSTVLILPGLAMAAEKYEIENCDKASELANSINISDQSVRVTNSVVNNVATKFSRKGSTIIVQVPANSLEATVAEAERKSRVSEEFTKITRIISEKKDLAAPPKDTFKCVRIVQSYDLSRITVSVKTGTDDKTTTTTKTYIGGPIEHWYFAADLPVTSSKQLSYDAKSASYVEKDVPPTFFVSLNYKVGDVYVNPKEFNPSFDNLSFKVMAKVNGPTEAYGLGVGYDIGSAVLFAARILTKNDPSASGVDSIGTYSTIFGVSFDIERGIGWLSGK